MIRHLCASALLLASLAACGGGGGSGGYGGPPPGPPGPPVTTVPLATASLNGGAGFVNASNLTVYVFDADTAANASTCSGACAGEWPPVTVAAGTAMPAPWTSFQRADGTRQLAYKTRALYTYAGDTAAGQFNGDNLNRFGALWHIARP